MSPLRAIVVGGSLSGLCAALALAADGAGGASVAAFPLITTNRDSTAWTLIYQWLRNLIDHRPRITVHHGAEVTQVRADASGATVVTPVGPFTADLVIGADGYRSIVRRSVAPAQPDATFAGYMLWRVESATDARNATPVSGFA
jgi:hypothetical protein